MCVVLRYQVNSLTEISESQLSSQLSISAVNETVGESLPAVIPSRGLLEQLDACFCLFWGRIVASIRVLEGIIPGAFRGV